MKRRSSLRTTLAPMPSTPRFCPPNRSYCFPRFPSKRSGFEFEFGCRQRLFRRLRDLHATGRVEHRFDDVVVAGAAADIAFQLVPDGLLVELAARFLRIMAVHDV